MIGWFGTAMLCYVTPKEHLGPAGSQRRQDRRHHLQDRRARGRSRQRPSGRAAARRRACRARASISAGRTSSTSRSIPTPRAPSTTQTLPKEGHKAGAFLLHVRAEVLLDAHLARGARRGARAAAWRRCRRSSGRRRRALRAARPRELTRMRVSVIGAGVAGLTCARGARRARREVRGARTQPRPRGASAAPGTRAACSRPGASARTAEPLIAQLGQEASTGGGSEFPATRRKARWSSRMRATRRARRSSPRRTHAFERVERGGDCGAGAGSGRALRSRRCSFAEEAHLDPRAALAALAARLGQLGVPTALWRRGDRAMASRRPHA